MGRVRHFDLCIIGSGSGNSILDERFDDLSVAVVEGGRFGGTCLNVGCIPTKMYAYPADLAAAPPDARRLGVDLSLDGVRWGDVRDRIFGRIDAISTGGHDWRAGNANVTVFDRHVRFVGERTLEVEAAGDLPAERFSAERFVIAAGSRPVLPDIEGLADLDGPPDLDGPAERHATAGADRLAPGVVHTSDTVMRLDEQPERVVVVGGGYIAAEFSHIFAAFGTAVTVLARGGVLLSNEDEDVSARFTEQLAGAVDLRLRSTARRVEPGPDGRGVVVHAVGADGEPFSVAGDILLLATGRVPNADTLDLHTTGVEVDDAGRVVVDAQQRTSAEGIWALGDVSSPYQLKHVANHEARVVQHNLLHPQALRSTDHRYVPHAVFSEPQVASVGLTEQAAREQGVAYVVGRTDYAGTAYGWAMEDEGHFVKVLADPATGLLLGAHLIGPQASSLIQPLIQAMHLGTPAHEVARGQYWIHPAMIEVVENALLQLPEPVTAS